MPCSLYLSVGDYFTELTAQNGGERLSQRWPGGLETLERRLAPFLEQAKIDQVERVVVETRRGLSAIERRLGSMPAVLVTSGFENWLDLNLPLTTRNFTVAPRRARGAWDTSLSFGLSERIDAQGRVAKALDTADLEFLAAKLKLNEVESVAVNLLHATANPAHELQAKEYLEAQGFSVFCSHEVSNHPFEVPRWMATALTAYIQSTLNEIEKSLVKALKLRQPDFEKKVEFITNQGQLVTLQQKTRLLDTVFGAVHLLSKWADRERSEWASCTYVGVERIFSLQRGQNSAVWESPLGPVALHTPHFQYFEVQPTRMLATGFWGVPGFSNIDLGFEPGPMCLGKGVQPTFLDLLFVTQRLKTMEGLNERFSEKSMGRIVESLTTLKRQHDSDTAPQDLANRMIQKVTKALSAENLPTRLVIGPLSEILAKSFTASPSISQMLADFVQGGA